MNAPASAKSDYLRRFEARLGKLPSDERDRVVLEIASHLAESEARGRLQESMVGLGAPDLLARSFVDDVRLTAALQRRSPVSLLFALLERSARSAAAGVTGFVAVVMYLASFTFLAATASKPVLKERVGFHLGDRELLGDWVYLVGPLAAVLLFLLADWLMRKVAARLLKGGPRL